MKSRLIQSPLDLVGRNSKLAIPTRCFSTLARMDSVVKRR